MKFNPHFYFPVVLLAAILAPAPAFAQDAAKPAAEAASVRKVVYHADFADPRRFSAMLQSINNMITTYQGDLQDYDVRIVFVSHGIRFTTTDALANTPFAWNPKEIKQRDEMIQRIGQLRDLQGVKLELCNITREAVNLGTGKLIPGVTLVPSGVVQIAELQSKGFAYLKIE
jgi:hypothetical protein